jgi:hypothetical protein
VRAAGERHVDLQHVAADDATGRMDHHAVADTGPFGMQAAQDAQGTVMAVVHDRLVAAATVREGESAAPTHGASRKCKSARV